MATFPSRIRRLVQFALLVLTASILLATVAAPPAAAQSLPERDARSVRSVVQAQLAAFAAGDAERAFSFASAGIQERFGSAATFMAMVVDSYPMVVRPTSVAFLKPRTDKGAVVQPVELRDQAGRQWLAFYGLSRGSGGAWRINGCVVTANAGSPGA